MTNYNRNLNGLRGLCAFLVFLRHIWGGPRIEGWWGDGLPAPAILDFLFDSLQCSVEIFFMISGFLITASLLHAPTITNFLIHRVLRIYPVFLVTHIVLFGLGPALHYKLLDGIGISTWLFLFTTNGLMLPGIFNFPLVQLNAWSLSYEAVFYAFAVAAFALRRQMPRPLLIALIGLVTADLCFIYPRAAFFAVGAIVYLMGEHAAHLGRTRWIVPALLLPLLLLLLQSSLSVTTAAETRLGYALGFLVGIPLFAGLTYGKGLFARFLNWAPMQSLGDISYSFYLWHPFAYFAGKKIVRSLASGLPPALQVGLLFVISLPTALVLSHISYRLIERRATGILRRRLLGSPLPHAA